MNTKRLSNIELLRIISMLFIIVFHCVYKSIYDYSSLNINTYIIKIFFFLGELGVNLFFLITGYFYKKNKVKSTKLIKMILEIYFYYSITSFIAYKLNILEINNINELLRYIFPISLTSYWFISAYLLIYIFSPLLNTVIDKISRRRFKNYLVIFLVLYSFIPTIIGLLYNSSELCFYYSRFIWAIIIYFIGAYINKYGFKFLDTVKKNSILVITNSLIMILSIFIFYKTTNLLNKLGTYEIAYFWTPNNIFMVFLSIGIFNLFLNLKFSNPIINIISSTTLGIYLIHDGPLANYIWNDIFNSNIMLNSPYFLIYILGYALIIFTICVIIDLIRKKLESITIDKLLESNFYKNIENKSIKLYKKLISYI